MPYLSEAPACVAAVIWYGRHGCEHLLHPAVAFDDRGRFPYLRGDGWRRRNVESARNRLGMLVFVPLGDTKERRSLMVRLAIAASLCLTFMATAHGFWWLALASFGVGLTGAIVHVIIPYAAHLAHPEAGEHRRHCVVGFAAWNSSGENSEWADGCVVWMAFHLLAGSRSHAHHCDVVSLWSARSSPAVRMSWLALICSAGDLVRRQPTLREAALLGAVFFGSFSAFWTTLTFFLQHPPYHYGSEVAGLFGLVGAVGAAAAPMIGRTADRYGARGNVLLAWS